MLSVECGPGADIDGVRASWNAALDADGCAAGPSTALVLVDRDVDTAVLFVELASCVGDSGISGVDPAASVPDATVVTLSR